MRPASGLRDPGRDVGAGLLGLGAEELGGGRSANADAEIEAVEQRAGDAAVIASPGTVAAPARPRGARLAAGARVHGGDEDDLGRIARGSPPTTDSNLSLLERLPQTVERGWRELAELVEEQHAAVRERDLAGPHRWRAAPDERHRGRAVMRRPERWPVDRRGSRTQLTRGGMHAGRLEGCLGRKRRQDAREASSQHRLAGAGRADHQQMVPAGRGDLDGQLRQRLAPDLGEIRAMGDGLGGSEPHRFGPGLRPAHTREQPSEIGHGVETVPTDECDLGLVAGGDDETFGVDGVGQRQRAPYGSDGAVETELAQAADVASGIAIDLPGGSEHTDGDGEVEPGSRFAELARRQVDRDPTLRPLGAARLDGRPDPVSSFAAGDIGKADHGEAGQAATHMDLDVDGVSPDAGERRRTDGGEHARSSRGNGREAWSRSFERFGPDLTAGV